ncbi:hypothetical protein TNIN_380001 [Trichonephila inaurata madagascariensis]|uniref:Uncharacterized protein n=1 Tax=Trichonephila inaurata madagascariensis TaxID=2747483 RepID=A0A8X7CB94_9ARAC|nr:hypothetical protein TNIN_380001 [Trichonephila inaurata madagascariensis]
MTKTIAEVTVLDLNDFAKFQRRVSAKLFRDLKSRLRTEYLELLAQKPSKPISHKMKAGEIEIQSDELPIATVGMERIPELPTMSEMPVDYSDREVNPKLTEVTPVMDVCKLSRRGRKIKPPQTLDLLKLTVFFEWGV